MTRTESYIILNSIRRVGPVRVRYLLERFQSVEGILSASSSQLVGVPNIGPAIAQEIVNWEQSFDLKKEISQFEKEGIGVIDCEDERYPGLLREIYDPPLVLYYKGNFEIASKRALSIVGSRRTSPYGFEMGRKIAYQAAYAGLTVTSGLARGIDTAAHQGALAAKGKTIAVFGCSLDKIYPPENKVLVEKILESDGLVLSEFPLNTSPDRYTFPMRNRIISGLSEGLLVVEAGKTSGALITAKMAIEQGRQVFAIPGRVDNPQSSGCHYLIKEGAKLVENIDDILNEYQVLFSDNQQDMENAPLPELTDMEQKVFALLEKDETPLDTIIQKSGLPSGVVSSTLLRLELKKLTKQLPGRYFIKTQ